MSIAGRMPLPDSLGPANRPAGSAASFSQALTHGERGLRWFIIGWLTISTILNLIDKQTLGIIAPFLPKDFGMSEKAYGQMDWLIRRGWQPAQARKRLLYSTGVIAPVGMLTGFAGSAAVSWE